MDTCRRSKLFLPFILWAFLKKKSYTTNQFLLIQKSAIMKYKEFLTDPQTEWIFSYLNFPFNRKRMVLRFLYTGWKGRATYWSVSIVRTSVSGSYRWPASRTNLSCAWSSRSSDDSLTCNGFVVGQHQPLQNTRQTMAALEVMGTEQAYSGITQHPKLSSTFL